MSEHRKGGGSSTVGHLRCSSSSRRLHLVGLTAVASVLFLTAGAAALQAAEPAKKAGKPLKADSTYESDPGKYVAEPSKNQEERVRKPVRPAERSFLENLNAAGLKSVMAEMPEGTRHEFVMMPLRDGVKLATDIFLPPSGDGPWPTVLLRTQYSRWDSRGFRSMGDERCVLVLQNVRGKYGSQGAGTFDSLSFDSDINDGHDTLDWIAKQKWSNGKVGMWGPSGHGIAPCNAMWSLNPHLTVVDVNVTGDNAYLHWTFSNGARRFLYSWLSQRGLETGKGEWPRPTTRPFDDKAYYDFIKEKAPKVKTYYRMKAGWFDLFSEAALDHFAVLAPCGRAFVQVGPGGHGKIGGDLEFKARNRLSAEAMNSSRGLKECLADEPQDAGSCLVYFLMGDTKDPAAPGNVWMTTERWPVAHAPTSYYMQQDGSLTLQAAKDKEACLSYDYDPKNPVPSLGGNYDVSDPKRLQIGPLDQRPLKDRQDILRFSTAPLAGPVGITGKVWVELHISSDAPDTMFTAKLVDIYPDGYEAVIRESAMLARYHQGLAQPTRLDKGKVYKLAMDCWSTALVFNKGHRIAVHISSSSDPAYEVHTNTYEQVPSIIEAKVARNTVHLTAEHPSKLILPVVAKETYTGVER